LVATLAQGFREERGRVLAILVGFLGDFDLAEEAAQEALAIAADGWPREGIPQQPARLVDDEGTQPSDRSPSPRPSPQGQAGGPIDRIEGPMNTTEFRMSAWSSSSPAARSGWGARCRTTSEEPRASRAAGDWRCCATPARAPGSSAEPRARPVRARPGPAGD